MTEWREFATLTGTSAGALIGLLFVAVSIRVEVIAASPELRARASQTLALFVTGLLEAVAVAIPGQPRWALGAELIALAAVAGVTLGMMDRRAERPGGSEPLVDMVDSAAVTYLTCVFLVAAGIVLILGHDWGVYLVVPTIVAVFVGGVSNAWRFLTRLEPAPPSESAR